MTQTTLNILIPEAFGAVGNGTTDDAVALQSWANALRDGGIGAAPSVAGYATSATIGFTPSTNSGPVRGPKILGNLKLIGFGTAMSNDLLRIWNPTAVTSSQNFYSPEFDSIEVSNTSGGGHGVSLRGFWGRIGSVSGINISGSLVIFPSAGYDIGNNTLIPDPYESSPRLGDLTGINVSRWVMENAIGIGASPQIASVRGTLSPDKPVETTQTYGCVYLSGNEKISGMVCYTGMGTAVTIGIHPAAPSQGSHPHEVFMQGCGDIDLALGGFTILDLEFAEISGHRMNIEPKNFSGINASWPRYGYSFGHSDGTGFLNSITVNAYVTIRSGVLLADIGDIFEFNNCANVINFRLNVTISDQTGIWQSMPLSSRYRNISSSAQLTIFENGLQVYPVSPSV